jgi:hypothetical protein
MVFDAKGFPIVQVSRWDDAPVIAAAPEMHELLKRLAKDVPRLIQPERIAVEAHALLARIDGKEPG